jgi:hypothetical protein
MEPQFTYLHAEQHNYPHWRSGTARGFLPQGCGFVSHSVDRLSTEPVCVGSRLHKPVAYTKRPGGHRRQMEARSRVVMESWSCVVARSRVVVI